MALSKFLACTVCALAVFATGCAEGTGKALTPTLPSADTNTTNPDGTRLKATVPEPAVPARFCADYQPDPAAETRDCEDHLCVGAPSSTISSCTRATLGSRSVERVPAGTETAAGWNVPANLLALNKTYSWRARAIFAGVAGSWSEMATFMTPLPPPPVEAVPCAVRRQFGCRNRRVRRERVSGEAGRHRSAATAASSVVTHNMEFIRDRIIETGRCKGLDLGRNFKRGTPVISHDFLVLRQPGLKDRGVDIAQGFDEVNLPLRLKFQVFGGPELWVPVLCRLSAGGLQPGELATDSQANDAKRRRRDRFSGAFC